MIHLWLVMIDSCESVQALTVAETDTDITHHLMTKYSASEIWIH